ncbi:L-lactate dehydrogenase [Anaerostipes sp. 494a]|uniref:L-lactate dehydrogenase n=1 Tax=Anaerostipes sp. 494a TaxID=1261636 RepID=UPI000952B822|nr:L-lactate dehydrogenase [Anaerostipes sp. 494a]OLR59964.1 L-lactate dehydrogenase [Anaerostipes sp. 494a]
MIKKRKVAIIGVGHVGAHCAYALALRGLVDELVLVDKNEQKVKSERQDLMDAIAYCPHKVNVSISDYGDLGDCDIIVNSLGKITLLEATHDRVAELNFTIKETTEMVPKVIASGFHGIFINITNPCDIITSQIAKISDLPKGHVFGTGTGLDTSRLLSALSQQTGIDHKSITAYMLGEHGNAIMVPMSQISFHGKALSSLQHDKRFQFDAKELKKRVIDGAWLTYEGKKCTEYGICSTLARCVEAVLHDEKTILPVSAPLNGEYGQNNIFVGVPAIIGSNGVEEIIELDLTPQEQEEFKACCDGVRFNKKLNDMVIE